MQASTGKSSWAMFYQGVETSEGTSDYGQLSGKQTTVSKRGNLKNWSDTSVNLGPDSLYLTWIKARVLAPDIGSNQAGLLSFLQELFEKTHERARIPRNCNFNGKFVMMDWSIKKWLLEYACT